MTTFITDLLHILCFLYVQSLVTNDNYSTDSPVREGPREETIVHIAAIQGGHSVFEKGSVVGGQGIHKKNWTPVVRMELTQQTHCCHNG